MMNRSHRIAENGHRPAQMFSCGSPASESESNSPFACFIIDCRPIGRFMCVRHSTIAHKYDRGPTINIDDCWRRRRRQQFGFVHETINVEHAFKVLESNKKFLHFSRLASKFGRTTNQWSSALQNEPASTKRIRDEPDPICKRTLSP